MARSKVAWIRPKAAFFGGMPTVAFVKSHRSSALEPVDALFPILIFQVAWKSLFPDGGGGNRPGNRAFFVQCRYARGAALRSPSHGPGARATAVRVPFGGPFPPRPWLHSCVLCGKGRWRTAASRFREGAVVKARTMVEVASSSSSPRAGGDGLRTVSSYGIRGIESACRRRWFSSKTVRPYTVDH